MTDMLPQTSPDLPATPYPVTILTLFPEAFPGLLGHSVMKRGQVAGAWALTVRDIRSFATDKHRTVDDTPYGGGAGMLMKPDVIAAAIRAARAAQPGAMVVYLGPAGRRFTQVRARELAAVPGGLIVLCGHYEGVDERVLESDVDAVISLGDFVLSGGEAAAVCLVDAVVRLLPGVLGAEASLHEESFDITDEEGRPLVEYPHYTRPPVWESRAVPPVLQSGHHGDIRKWRLAEAKRRTALLADGDQTKR